MALDLAALKAKVAAQKLAQQAAATTPERTNETNANTNQASSNTGLQPISSGSSSTGSFVGTLSTKVMEASLSNVEVTPGKEIPINHMDFLTKLNDLREAIHTQHPRMPTLLKEIHTQLRKDPEIVTLLNEEGIGIVVLGLQKQTKTELISTAVKATAAKSKKVALTDDMF